MLRTLKQGFFLKKIITKMQKFYKMTKNIKKPKGNTLLFLKYIKKAQHFRAGLFLEQTFKLIFSFLTMHTGVKTMILFLNRGSNRCKGIHKLNDNVGHHH